MIELEENDSPVPSGAGPKLQPAAAAAAATDSQAVVVDALPDDLTQEEIDAAEAEAQWLLNPLSMLDLSETKEKLMRMMAEGIAYQKAGQYANARSVYTRAIAMEAPNKRMTASLYYNRVRVPAAARAAQARVNGREEGVRERQGDAQGVLARGRHGDHPRRAGGREGGDRVWVEG